MPEQIRQTIESLTSGELSSNGTVFFPALVSHLAGITGADMVFVSEFVKCKQGETVTIALYSDGGIRENQTFSLNNTPCEEVYKKGYAFYPSGVKKLFPKGSLLADLSIEAYAGIALFDYNRRPIGQIACLSRSPLKNASLTRSLLELLSIKASYELERNLMEDTLRGSESRLYALLNSLPDIMYVISEDGRLLECHGQDKSGLFPPSKELKGKHITKALKPAIYESVGQTVQSALKSGNTLISEFDFPLRDSRNFFEFRCTKCGPGEVLLIIRDITTQKEFEATLTHLFEEVSRAKVEWEATFNSVSEFIVLTDSRYRIIRCNRSFGEFMEKQPAELVNEDFSVLLQINPPDREKHLSLLANGKPVSHAWLDPEGRWLYISQRPLFDPLGATQNIVITVSNITDVMEIQQELIRSDKELKDRIDELERFYNMVIGREIKMRELKKRNIQLERELELLKSRPLDS